MGEILGVFGIDWKLLLIQAVNFGVLLLILWRFLYRPVVSMIEERKAKIEQGVADAEVAKQERRKIEEEKAALISAATKEGETLLTTARAKSEVLERELLENARTKSDALLEEAERKALELKRKTLEESKEEVARAAVLSAEKILQTK